MPPERRFADVSVIIPAYHAANTIARALKSVAAQTLRPREVIVVDDGSDDGTYEAALAMAERMNGVALKVVRQAHHGAGAARNRALAGSAQPYLAFLDADDEWLPEKLERSLCLLREKNSDLVSHNYTMIEGSHERTIDCAHHFLSGEDPFIPYVLRGYIATSTVVVRRDLLLDAGGFDPSLPSGQDHELWLVLISTPGVRLHVFPETLTRYHVIADSISSRVDLRLRCSLAILHRHVPRLKGRRRLPLYVAWMRTVIIHHQAFLAHLSRKEYVRALWDCLGTPVSLISTARALVVKPQKRPNFLNND